MGLAKYLKKLAGKGAPQAKLAESVNQSMRNKILAEFAEKHGSVPAYEMLKKEGPANFRRQLHPDVSYRQYNAANGKLWDKIHDADTFGEWSALGQPSSEGLEQWAKTNDDQAYAAFKKLHDRPEPGRTTEQHQALRNKAHQLDKNTEKMEKLAKWLKTRKQ